MTEDDLFAGPEHPGEVKTVGEYFSWLTVVSYIAAVGIFAVLVLGWIADFVNVSLIELGIVIFVAAVVFNVIAAVLRQGDL